MASARSIPAIVHALEPLLDLPGAFIPGNNDYYQPKRRSPIWYFLPKRPIERPPELPWPELARAMGRRGWADLTNRRAAVKVGDAVVAFAGTDDPHLFRDAYHRIAGPADPDAVVRIAAIHAPEPRLITRFAADGYDLLLAGHTHGGQVRIPFGPAIVTNCGLDRHRARGLHAWDDRMMFNVSAGIGTNPYLPIRFCCRPEASLLTLVPRR
jgi:predicted MPP superfamily phosphohydrolase